MLDKKQDHEKNGVSPVTAAITGAVVGAGIAVVGTVALSDKNNREKIKKILTNTKDKAVDYVENMQKQAKDKGKTIHKKIAEGVKHEIKGVIDEATISKAKTK